MSDALTLIADDPLDLVVPPGPLDVRVLRVEPPLYLDESAGEKVVRIVYRPVGANFLQFNLDWYATALMPAAPILTYDYT